MKKENTHIVIKKKDIFLYLSKTEQATLKEMLDKITSGRAKAGKQPCNRYYVINKDEPYAEVIRGIIIGGEAAKEQSEKAERVVTSDADCADCLCRVCARNSCNDSYNHKLENGFANCECNCKIGDKLIETEDDCPNFLPDENM